MFSIGIMTGFYLLPKDVSFKNLFVKEGSCKCIATGWFKDTVGLNEEHPEWPDPQGTDAIPLGDYVLQGDIDTGCRVEVWGDKAELDIPDTPLPYATGTASWNIPWLLSVNGIHGPWIKITTVEEKFTVDANGHATVTKGGSAPGENNHSDAAQDY